MIDKKIYRYILYWLGLFLLKVAQLLPRCFILIIGKKVGSLCYLILKKQKMCALRNLEKVFLLNHNADRRKYNKGQLRNICRQVFENLGISFLEFLQMPKLRHYNTDCIFEVKGLEKIEQALKQKKGLIMLAAHFGNWEYLGAFFSLMGYNGAVIGRRIYFKPYNDLICNLRNSVGVQTLDRSGSVKPILKILKENKLVGILPDQDTKKVDGVFVDFFNYPAYTPTGPINIALATGAPIVPCFIVRKKDKHHIFIEDQLKLVKYEDKMKTVKENTQKWTHILEKYIQQYPDQWAWIHRRWKTKKDDF